MNKFIHLSAAGLIALTSIGCAGRQYQRSGDSAYAQGDMRTALYNYQRAADYDADLYADPAFAQKLAHAESRVAYTDAVRLERAQRYEAAIEKLQVSLDRDPGYADAAALLEQTQRLAGEERLTRAIQYADQGDLARAELELNKALVHLPLHPGIGFAKASLIPGSLDQATPGLKPLWEASDAASKRDWPTALSKAEETIRRNAYLLPARELRFVSVQNIQSSEALTAEAERHFNSQNIGPSLDTVSEALDIWPGNQSAKSLQEQAIQARELAETQYQEANALAGERQWDAAIAKADSALAIDRSLGTLNRLREALPTRAAEDATRVGLDHLNQGEIEQAETAFRHALTYREDHASALRGMAQAYEAWGKALEADGRLGAALLHYRVGRGYAKIGPVDEGYARSYVAVRDGLGVGLSFEVEGKAGGDISGRQVGSSLAQSLERARRAGLQIGGKPSHSLVTTIKTADIDTRVASRDNRTHPYIVQEWVHNDAYDHIRDELRRETHHLEDLCRQYHRATGHSHRHHDPHHDNHVAHLYHDICRHERDVERLQHELRRTPHEIQVDVKKYWDFVVETHEMTGSLVTQTEVIDNATGKVIDSFDTRTGVSAEDQTILNANPSIGLRPDPLDLPDPRHVADDLAAQIAGSISDRVVNTIVQQRLNQLNTEAASLREAGKTDQALEIEVQAAVLLGILDPQAMNETLDRLGQQRTR